MESDCCVLLAYHEAPLPRCWSACSLTIHSDSIERSIRGYLNQPPLKFNQWQSVCTSSRGAGDSGSCFLYIGIKYTLHSKLAVDKWQLLDQWHKFVISCAWITPDFTKPKNTLTPFWFSINCHSHLQHWFCICCYRTYCLHLLLLPLVCILNACISIVGLILK